MISPSKRLRFTAVRPIQEAQELIEQSEEIALVTMRHHCDMVPWERENGYVTGREAGLHLKDDPMVACLKVSDQQFALLRGGHIYVWSKEDE